MSVDVAVARVPARERLSAVERVLALPARMLLFGLVAASFLVRFLAALAHAVPVYFPDEYIYGALARGIAEDGRPTIRGANAHFPALLEPLLAAPAWLAGDPMLAYRLTQAENALAMSLAAIPVYLLARRLSLGKGTSLACGALAVAAPGVFFSSFVLADPIAYPLVLGAVCAGVHALAAPTRRAQVAFLTLAGLATFARVQYVVLPVAFAAAGLVLERGRVRAFVSRFRLTLGLLAVPLAGGLALGASRVLGYYSGIFDQNLRPGTLLHWVAVDALLLAYASGWVLVPGVLIGLAYALRAEDRAERAFGALVPALGVLVFAEAAIYASNGTDRFQERYLIALVPLAPIAFALYAKRGFPQRRLVVVLALALVALSARFPLSAYTNGDDKQDSPLLFAIFRLQKNLGTSGGVAAVAVVAGLLALVAVLAPVWKERGLRVCFAATGAVFALIAVGAYAHDANNSVGVRVDFMPLDLRWVDNSGLGEVALVQTEGAPSARGLEQAFWNRSIGSVLLLGRTAPVDSFRNTRVEIARDGTLLENHRPVRRPLLVQNFATRVLLSGAENVARGSTFDLWRPLGTPKLSLLAIGRYSDGWLAGRGFMIVWPDETGAVQGSLRMRLTVPPTGTALTLRFKTVGLDRKIALRSGEVREVSFPVDVREPWTVQYESSMHADLWDGRAVSVKIEGPIFERAGTAVDAASPARGSA